jgi:hypothetical protein
MDALWPNDDGREWRYDQHFESFVNSQVADNQVRIFFSGATVAPDGIQAQYLREQLIGGAALTTALAALVPDPFLRQLWEARPDLHEKILQAVNDNPCPEYAPNLRHALLLGGEFAYRKTSDEIAAWRCNRANTRSWLWLVSDLTIGNTFTLQLVPDVASSVFLHGTVAAIEPVTVPGGTFTDCVRVDYVIDYGGSVCTDEDGDVIGTLRSETRGYVHYAPFVGPVQSDEQFIVTEATGTCVPTVGAQSQTSLRLFTPSVPVLPRTWGQLKVLYR